MFKRSHNNSQPGSRPPSAVEISPDGVLAAALPRVGHEPSYAFVALPPGALTPGIAEPNLRAPEAVAEAIRSALDDVSPRKRSVTLVLPDASVRVFVLDFDAFPSKAAEAVPVLRFRLRKMVAFDVEQAGIGYQLLSQSSSECKVLTAVLPGPILAEYESAVRQAGYEPGAVLPSSLAALETIDSEEPALTVILGSNTLTTTISSGNDLLLYRTLDLPATAGERSAELQRGIAVAAAFFEDKLGTRPRHINYAGSEPRRNFAGSIGETELRVVPLAESPSGAGLSGAGSTRTSIAGVAGALALHGLAGVR